MKSSFVVQTACMNPLQTNCYIVSKDNDCIIIDPSYDNGRNIDRILKKIGSMNVLAILLTHGHYDHISAVDLLLSTYNCPVYISEIDAPYLTNNRLNMAAYIEPNFIFNSSVTLLPEKQCTIGPISFKIMPTPGHTPGSVSFIFDDIIFSGDSLFKNSIGRTDLPGGSVVQMRSTLDWFYKQSLNYKIYPGHGDMTYLEKEKLTNIYFKQL